MPDTAAPSAQTDPENQIRLEKDADRSITHAGPAPIGLADTPAAEAAKAAALEGYAHGMTLPNAEDVPAGAPGCQHCEVLPTPLKGPGTLRLVFPHTFTLGKILEFLIGSPWEHREADGVLSVRALPGSLAPLLSPILDRMSSPEQRGHPGVVPAGRPPARFSGDRLAAASGRPCAVRLAAGNPARPAALLGLSAHFARRLRWPGSGPAGA